MLRHQSRLCLAMGLVVCICGCNQRRNQLEITSEKMNETLLMSKPYFTLPAFSNMVDNGMLHDMSMADFHFVAHTSELSGTGVARLDRMAKLLQTYGGTVRYETFVTDEEFINERIKHVGEYLALLGCDMARVEVKSMMSGGRGMPATDAIRINAGSKSSNDESTQVRPEMVPDMSGQTGS